MTLDYLIDDDRRTAVRKDHVKVKEHGYDVCYSCSDEWPCVAVELLWSLETMERLWEKCMVEKDRPR